MNRPDVRRTSDELAAVLRGLPTKIAEELFSQLYGSPDPSSPPTSIAKAAPPARKRRPSKRSSAR